MLCRVLDKVWEDGVLNEKERKNVSWIESALGLTRHETVDSESAEAESVTSKKQPVGLLYVDQIVENGHGFNTNFAEHLVQCIDKP